MGTIKGFLNSGYKVKGRDLADFCSQCGALLEAGLPLDEGLELLLGQNGKRGVIRVLSTLYEQVRKGSTLAAAAAALPQVFSPFFVQMAELGETTGQIPLVLDELHDYYSGQEQIKRDLRSALAYPCVVLTVALLVVIFLLVWIMPIFSDVFVSMDAVLPPLTQAFLSLGDGFRRFWYLLPLLILLLVLLLQWSKRKPELRHRRDRILLSLPFVGRLVLMMETIRFCRAMDILLRSGQDSLSALITAQAIVSNYYLKKKLALSLEVVREGGDLSTALTAAGIFEALVIKMTAVGEKTGHVDEQMGRIATFYASEFKYRTQMMATYLEPAVIIFVGGLVLLIVLSTMMPIYEIYEGYNSMS